MELKELMQVQFEQVAKHLFKQGVQAVNKSGTNCVYRGPNGLKCAIGALIHDDEYNPCMEANSVCNLVAKDMLPKRLLDMMEVHGDGLLWFWQALQDAHDSSLNWMSTKAMRQRLLEVAAQFSLDVEFLDQLQFADR